MSHFEKHAAIGLMSGTSLDGIDAALAETDGDAHFRLIAFESRAYDPALRTRLRDAALRRPQGSSTSLGPLVRDLTDCHADLVAGLLASTGWTADGVRVIGFHGHTLWHAPEAGLTLQIGDGGRLAARTGIDVIYDLRTADIEAGGQGAPLVPVFHRALSAGHEKPVAVANIGGVANVTYVGAGQSGGDDLIAFDTGPGVAAIDDFIRERTGDPFDASGRLGLAGRIDWRFVEDFLADPYFSRPPPKSLDRDHFAQLRVARLDGFSTEDGAATLAACTAGALARAADFFPAPPLQWLLTGGGRRNEAVVAALRGCTQVPIVQGDTVGWTGDAIEAAAFAYLAVRRLAGLPATYPGTTGARLPTRCGRLAKKPA